MRDRHSKPTLHDGEKDTLSTGGNLGEAVTVRLPAHMREKLDEIADDPDIPMTYSVGDAGSIVREFIAAGLLKQTLEGYNLEDALPVPPVDDEMAMPEYLFDGLHENLDEQLTIRMPGWMKMHIHDESGEDEWHIAEGKSAATRELIVLGERLYRGESFPFGYPTTPNDDVLCPHCSSEATTAIWQRTFQAPLDMEDLLDDLSRERDNPYRTYVESNFVDHGWGDPQEIPNHPLAKYDRREGEISTELPEIDAAVTVCHCHMCDYTDQREEFVKAYHLDR